MRVGRLDRLITLRYPTEATDTFGVSGTTVWNDYANAWANVSQMSATERFQSQQRYSIKTSKFKIRFIAGVLPTFRIHYDNFIWRILGISEIERREALEILAETIDPFDQPVEAGSPLGITLGITNP